MQQPQLNQIDLRELGNQDEKAFLNWIEDWKGQDLFWATFAWEPGISHKEHLQKLEEQKDKNKIPSNRVPATMFYAFVENEIVGRLNIRHELNSHLMQRGGHVGYAVSPKHRHKGYATEIFRQGLKACQNLGLEKILITCGNDNVPSWKIIEKFHGSLENRIYDSEEEEFVRRYWLHIEEALHPKFETKDKVVAYIIRQKGIRTELLVFDHDKVHSEAGTQVPAGTVDANENFEEALLREIVEEAGIQNLKIVEKIDQYTFFRETHGCFNRRHIFTLQSSEELPDRWTHTVTGHGIDQNLNFHYYWIDIEEAKGKLSARLDDSIDIFLKRQSKDEPIKRPESHFDDDLRDVPNNPDEWIQFIESLKLRLNSENQPEKQQELIEHIGMAARTLMRLDEAESYLQKALALSKDHPKPNRLIQNLVRLAHVYQWKKDFTLAQSLFDQAKSLIQENPVSDILLAAYHQHLGKLYFDQNFYGKAQAEFATALSIRQKISAPRDQLESSQGSYNEALKRWKKPIPSGHLLRKALPQDAEAIHLAHMTSIREICSRHHSEEEIKGWGNRPYRADQRLAAIAKDFVLVVDINNLIEGYGHLRVFEKDGIKRAHLFGLYLTPKAIGKSLGKVMFEIMVEEARLAHAQQMTLESTLTAQNFYRKMGFVDSGPPMSVDIGGSQVRCFPMKMEIS